MGKNVIISTLPNISQNYLPKVNTSNIFANSLVYDDGSSVLINTTTASAYKLDVNGTGRFQGALTGTSATFSSALSELNVISTGASNIGSITIQGGEGANAQLTLQADDADNASDITILRQADGGTFSIITNNGGVNALQIAATTGAATFSGNLTTNSGVNYFNGTTDSVTYYQIGGTSGGHVYLTSTKLELSAYSTRNMLFETNGVTRLTISSTGAASFSSSVTAGGVIATSGTGLNSSVRIANTTATTGVDWHLYSLNNGNFGIYNNTAGAYALQISSTGAATFSGNVTIDKSSPNLSLYAPTGTSAQYNINNSSGTLHWAMYSTIGGAGAQGNWSLYSAGKTGGAGNVIDITPGGNVGINSTSPTRKLEVVVSDATAYTTSSSGNVLGIGNISPTTNSFSGITFYAEPTSGNAGISAINNIVTGSGDAALAFSTRGGSTLAERMRITSGGTVLVGTTSTTGVATGSSANPGVNIGPGASSFQVNNNSNIYLSKASGYTSNDFTAHFVNGTYVGGISTNGSSTTYATSSDYRLKTDLKDFVGIDIVKLLNVYDYQWVLNKSRSFGVLAHELQSVLPDAVTGVKDGEQMQGVDYSKLTPILVKAIQEQQAQIEEQKADIESLKALINK